VRRFRTLRGLEGSLQHRTIAQFADVELIVALDVDCFELFLGHVHAGFWLELPVTLNRQGRGERIQSYLCQSLRD